MKKKGCFFDSLMTNVDQTNPRCKLAIGFQVES